MLKLKQIHSGYRMAPVLNGVSLTVHDGEILAVLGRNGSGKTTLLKTIVGLLPITSGQLHLNDRDLTRLPPYDRVKRGIGYVPQGREIFASLSVRENILSGQYKRVQSTENNIEWLLDLFPMLAAKLNQRGDSLSGGQQQQLAIARALVARPKILLLDEPSDGIQPNIVLEIVEKLKEINRLMGTTIILVEQNLEVVKAVAQHVHIMVKGELVDHLNANQLSFDNALIHQHLGV
ncbi:MAG TPA: ABC transporter ATP-binding protein [Crinalium sp.]|jgi:urea ABC transporter ATP-binding protein UrtE